jgi:hypothetical protein
MSFSIPTVFQNHMAEVKGKYPICDDPNVCNICHTMHISPTSLILSIPVSPLHVDELLTTLEIFRICKMSKEWKELAVINEWGVLLMFPLLELSLTNYIACVLFSFVRTHPFIYLRNIYKVAINFQTLW